MTCILVGLFDSRREAERAVDDLLRATGAGREAVEVFGAGPEAEPAIAVSPLDALAQLPLSEEDGLLFREGIRRGHFVVAAQVADAQTEHALAAFEAAGATDLDAREATWQAEGFSDEPGQEHGAGGYTGHDEDIGFATFGGDAVLGRIPRRHHDDTPAGLIGRLEMASMRSDPARSRARVRVYIREAGRP
ncbi:MAG TPA: hypothetical protein VNZ61_21660 [Roseomonas sp.]|nr:hypothetical protein [Roseomonas sp.]